MSPNSMVLEVTKISKYKGKYITMYFKIRRHQDALPHNHVPYEWISGAIRLDMTRIFSATFQRWYDLRYDQETKLYMFNRTGMDKDYEVVEEIVEAVDKINTELFLLDCKP